MTGILIIVDDYTYGTRVLASDEQSAAKVWSLATYSGENDREVRDRGRRESDRQSAGAEVEFQGLGRKRVRLFERIAGVEIGAR